MNVCEGFKDRSRDFGGVSPMGLSHKNQHSKLDVLCFGKRIIVGSGSVLSCEPDKPTLRAKATYLG
jgi:hypothetical protein